MNYKGDIEPQEAFDTLSQEENSFLVDVRTIPEWSFVGLPNLDEINKEVITISWLQYPNMEVNPEFIEQLTNAIKNKDSKIFFICKVGGRSMSAANIAATQGFNNCFNIIGGFEGDQNEDGHRGKINGWKASNLPWIQG